MYLCRAILYTSLKSCCLSRDKVLQDPFFLPPPPPESWSSRHGVPSLSVRDGDPTVIYDCTVQVHDAVIRFLLPVRSVREMRRGEHSLSVKCAEGKKKRPSAAGTGGMEGIFQIPDDSGD